MTVKELIEKLKKFDENFEVEIYNHDEWDSFMIREIYVDHLNDSGPKVVLKS